MQWHTVSAPAKDFDKGVVRVCITCRAGQARCLRNLWNDVQAGMSQVTELVHRSSNPRITMVVKIVSSFVIAVSLVGCGLNEAKTSTDADQSGWSLDRVVDGDTIWVTDSNGNQWNIRLIGIDTPERGECGFEEAGRALEELLSVGSPTLSTSASADKDKYDRLLRYVDVAGVDVGLELIKAGYAIARYDSRDGYGAHLRELSYIDADANSPNLCNQ
jgi:endonuclease YncB( thermonuclease family)